VAQAAELTGLSAKAIRARIRRGELQADIRDDQESIPLAELRRQDLLVEGDRYRSARERVESLESQLRDAVESRKRIQQELEETQEKVRVMWGMTQQREWRLQQARERPRGRWPFRRGSGRSAKSS